MVLASLFHVEAFVFPSYTGGGVVAVGVLKVCAELCLCAGALEQADVVCFFGSEVSSLLESASAVGAVKRGDNIAVFGLSEGVVLFCAVIGDNEGGIGAIGGCDNVKLVAVRQAVILGQQFRIITEDNIAGVEAREVDSTHDR